MKIIARFFFLLGIIAFLLGIYMFIDPTLLSTLEPTMRTVLAIILLLYGVFRISTAIGGMRKKQESAAK